MNCWLLLFASTGPACFTRQTTVSTVLASIELIVAEKRNKILHLNIPFVHLWKSDTP